MIVDRWPVWLLVQMKQLLSNWRHVVIQVYFTSMRFWEFSADRFFAASPKMYFDRKIIENKKCHVTHWNVIYSMKVCVMWPFRMYQQQNHKIRKWIIYPSKLWFILFPTDTEFSPLTIEQWQLRDAEAAPNEKKSQALHCHYTRHHNEIVHHTAAAAAT